MDCTTSSVTFLPTPRLQARALPHWHAFLAEALPRPFPFLSCFLASLHVLLNLTQLLRHVRLEKTHAPGPLEPSALFLFARTKGIPTSEETKPKNTFSLSSSPATINAQITDTTCLGNSWMEALNQSCTVVPPDDSGLGRSDLAQFLLPSAMHLG